MRLYVEGAADMRLWMRVLMFAAAVTLVLCAQRAPTVNGEAPLIGGPYARLLAHATDLGPDRGGHVQLVVALGDVARPQDLISWAAHRELTVQWAPGQDWAIIDGGADKVADAFGVAVHNYRTGDGHVFYAAARQPGVPSSLRGQVTDVGRILGYGRRRVAKPPIIPLDVPDPGLTPTLMVTAYDVTPLAATGKGQTIAFYEWGGYDTTDLDAYATHFKLPPFNIAPPIGGMPPPGDASGETMMDLEAAHAVAPDARLVVVNANTYFPGNNFAWSQVASMFAAVDHQYPGVVWSSSIGIAPCDQMIKGVDAQPAESALETAESHGTSAFDASGDTGGLECKEDLQGQWGTKPSPQDIGLDSIASLPAMTDVGGTTLSTDSNGVWLSEETWVDYPMQQGTGGGVSAIYNRPDWQSRLSVAKDSGNPLHRLTPDVAAVADPDTGMVVRADHSWDIVGGTSLAAPLWAGFAAVINEYLTANGGHQLGNLDPLLYQAAASGAEPAFHDVSLGGNNVDTAGPGYDLVTGLGTPDVATLAHDILDIQKAGR